MLDNDCKITLVTRENFLSLQMFQMFLLFQAKIKRQKWEGQLEAYSDFI